MLLEDLAIELVQYTSELLDGRTVNVMNTEGIIVASTEEKRIGTFHQGALNAVLSGQPVSIRRDQLDRYPGAKEGYNMPLRVGGSVIGVVGVFGDPDQIRSLAHLVEVYAEKCYQLEALLQPRYSESVLRDTILRRLLESTPENYRTAVDLMNSQKIDLIFPVTAVVADGIDGLMPPERAEQVQTILATRAMLRPDRDISGIVDGRLVILLSAGYPRVVDLPAGMENVRISVGDPAQSYLEIHRSYEEALILNSFAVSNRTTLEDIGVRTRYMLYRSSTLAEGFFDTLWEKLNEVYSPEEIDSLLGTAEVYYECGRSVTEAAARLYVHKNTLQYRLKRLLTALELKDCAPFQQEYLIRLFAEHYKRKQGRRTLKY